MHTIIEKISGLIWKKFFCWLFSRRINPGYKEIINKYNQGCKDTKTLKFLDEIYSSIIKAGHLKLTQ